MEPAEKPLEPRETYVTFTAVEEISVHQCNGQVYIVLEGIGARFWIKPGTTLRKGDRVRLSFHKEPTDVITR